MKIRLTDRVCILNFKNDFEKKLMNKFLTYKDTSKCFIGGKYDPMKEQNVHFLKESSKKCTANTETGAFDFVKLCWFL